MTLHGVGLGARRGTRQLFSNLDLALQPGSITVVVGPNGAGKSTLLRGLCGLFPLEGRVRLDDVPLDALDPRTRARALSYLPQQTPSTPGLRVHDVVMLGRLPHRSRLAGPSRSDRDAVTESLLRVGMESFTDRALHTLSGGERQRVMLARMLATGSATMLLDEPTAALDVRHALDLLGTLRSLAGEGRAIALALHDLQLADAYADQVVCLSGHGAVEVGSPTDVLTPSRLDDVFGATFARDAEGRLQLHLGG